MTDTDLPMDEMIRKHIIGQKIVALRHRLPYHVSDDEKRYSHPRQGWRFQVDYVLLENGVQLAPQLDVNQGWSASNVPGMEGKEIGLSITENYREVREDERGVKFEMDKETP